MEKKAMLFAKEGKGRVRCLLCGHRCLLDDSSFGICGVRQNRAGVLFTLVYADVIAACADPVEKKPFYHFCPGSRSFSLATIGCNFQCSFCQNWQISQVNKKKSGAPSGETLSPEDAVAMAQKNGCRSVAYTYTEPTVFFEYAYDTARLAHEKGLYNLFVTNGFMTDRAVKTIRPYLDGANVDLKSFRDDFYRATCRASLQPVLETIRLMKESGIWVEVTTLVVPGLNDSPRELSDIAAFLFRISPDIPWHISRFHPDFRDVHSTATPLETLKRAYETGKESGLKHVYLGNVSEETNTRCPRCGRTVIRRRYFDVLENRIKKGSCPFCSEPVAGVWE